jgi:hypothetical protein
VRSGTYGSPITKLSPALIDGTRPRDPTRAAAPSLYISFSPVEWESGVIKKRNSDR